MILNWMWKPGNQHLRICFDSIIKRKNRKGHGGQFNESVVAKLKSCSCLGMKAVSTFPFLKSCQ